MKQLDLYFCAIGLHLDRQFEGTHVQYDKSHYDRVTYHTYLLSFIYITIGHSV